MDPQQDRDGDRDQKPPSSDWNFILSQTSSEEVNLLLTVPIHASDTPPIRRLLSDHRRIKHTFTELAQNTKLYDSSIRTKQGQKTSAWEQKIFGLKDL